MTAAFIPLVPDASSGRRGVFSQTSQPGMIVRARPDVVVLEEDDAALDARVARELDDLLHHVLAGLVGGVGLAGDDDLDGQREQALEVA